jgi:signal transduction histidine kinase
VTTDFAKTEESLGGSDAAAGTTWFQGELPQELRHDARQAVATVLMLAAAGKTEADDTDLVRKRLDQIAGEVRALAALLDEGTEVRELTPFVDVCAEVSEAVRVVSTGYGGTVRLVARTGAWALMQPTSLRRVLTNLLRNAQRAAGADGMVQVTVVKVAEAVLIVVEDDGPGFGALPVINGVGLRSARRLVADAGGRLDIGTGRLGGAAVRVTLPTRTFSGASHEDLVV